ncbi:MAG: Eco57I restriction-modification methylase domain-containing protein [Hungatella sp.]
MEAEKQSGSYYTPHELVAYMMSYMDKAETDLSMILEPSAGDGRFIGKLEKLAGHIDALELFREKVNVLQQCGYASHVAISEGNFLDYALENLCQYSLIIGNPPYISPRIMKKDDIAKAKQLCELEGIKPGTMQNMWLAFVVGACRLLRADGTIFFVLPMEFLQVQYAEALREYLEKRFNHIHIIAFEESVFPDIEQEICLVYLTNQEQYTPYISYEVYHSVCDRVPIQYNKIEKNKPLKKWSNAILADADMLLLKEKAKEYKTISQMGITAPGIVTGGNEYFILKPSWAETMQCEAYTIPIIQKSSLLKENTIVIHDHTVQSLHRQDVPLYLLNLANVSETLPPKLAKYLEAMGETERDGIKLKERYKCSKRTPWYGVPLVHKGDVIFFKRYDKLPKVYINEAEIDTTDAGYHIRLMPGYDKASVVFCFYNSLTLTQCEFLGRYYGGGVCELVPSEFKALAIPYHRIEKHEIQYLDELFRKQATIDEIVRFVNSKTLALDCSPSEIRHLDDMRMHLIARRLKNKL